MKRRGSTGQGVGKGTASLAAFFRALADGSRLRLLGLLENGPQSVDALATALRAPQPKVPRHLAYLRRAGLVAARREGRRVFYRLVPPSHIMGRACLEVVYEHLAKLPDVIADRRRLPS